MVDTTLSKFLAKWPIKTFVTNSDIMMDKVTFVILNKLWNCDWLCEKSTLLKVLMWCFVSGLRLMNSQCIISKKMGIVWRRSSAKDKRYSNRWIPFPKYPSEYKCYSNAWTPLPIILIYITHKMATNESLDYHLKVSESRQTS